MKKTSDEANRRKKTLREVLTMGMGLDSKLKKFVIFLLAAVILACGAGIAVLIAKKSAKPKHEHVFNQKIESIGFVKDFASCEDYATYYYACKCSDDYYESAKKYLDKDGKLPNGESGYYVGESEDSKPTGHTETGGSVEQKATCTTDGKIEAVTCGVCGKILEAEKTIPAFGHQWNEIYVSENGTHKLTCKNYGCNAVKDEAACTGGVATCTKKAICEVCGNEYGEVNPENHSAEAYKYVSNENGTHRKIRACCNAEVTETCEYGEFVKGTYEHHKTCGFCSDQTEKGEHTFEETGCTVCGKVKYNFIADPDTDGYIFWELYDKNATTATISATKIDKDFAGYEKKITAIDEDAFDKCTKLQTVYFDGTEEEWKAIGGDKVKLPQGAQVIFSGNS